MTKIYFKDNTSETISDDLLKTVSEFGTVLREKLGDDSERVFREICSDVFDYAMSQVHKRIICFTYDADIDEIEENIDEIENPF